MRTVALGSAALGVAFAAACLQLAGKDCTEHQDCEFREYCDSTLGKCVGWEGFDPSCDGGCGPLGFCNHGYCQNRYPGFGISPG